MTEKVEVTGSIFQALLNMTSDPDSWTAPTERFVRALHKASYGGSNGRWVLELTEQDIETLHYILQVYLLNRPLLRERFNNWMLTRCATYRRIHIEFEERATAPAATALARGTR